MTTPPIGPYVYLPAVCKDWDPRAPEVARRVAALIAERMPEAVAEHVGSSSVPGCAGKGVIDLMILYPTGRLQDVKDTLAALGFQPQSNPLNPNPFPEDRPLRIGAIEHEGTRYRIHAHVVVPGSEEIAELRRFRDRLRADPELLADYVARKREIIASGVTVSHEYAEVKGDFVQRALREI